MNDLENQLAKVVEKAIQVAEQTGEFVIEQAPDLLREFYLWHTIHSALWIVLSMFVFYLIWRIGKSISKKDNEDYYDFKFLGRYYEEDSAVPYFSISSIVFIVFLFVLLFNIFDLTKIIVAPKLYLIEYFVK